ncbi:MAG: iron-sulfur cluster assembly protein, partial [Anaerolineae bacterium]
MATLEQVKQALEQVMDPDLGKNILELGMARDIVIENGVV